jgi:mRNA-degrading endonuclease toxin of MazEF toxin-antitoxin module
MADKIMAVSRTKLGRRLGAVSPADMARVQAALIIVLGFEGGHRRGLLHVAP